MTCLSWGVLHNPAKPDCTTTLLEVHHSRAHLDNATYLSYALPMNWLPDYIKAWDRHGIHFGSIRNLSILNVPRHPEAVVVEDESLVYRFSHSCRQQDKRGQLNQRFLDPATLLRVLDGLPEESIVILSIPPIYATEGLSFTRFLNKFDSFLGALPCPFRYAVELNNPNLALPDYFDCLRRHRIAHVIQSETMFTTDFGLVLRVKQEDAVYVVRQALEQKKILYMNVEQTDALVEIMELLNQELKRLSPIQGGPRRLVA